MKLTLTDLAAEKIKSQLERRGQGLGIRVGVKTTGCSGLAYVMEFVDELDEHDTVFEDKGSKIIINDKSLVYFEELTIDYQKRGLNEGFEFINSAESGRCGCGESFTV